MAIIEDFTLPHIFQVESAGVQVIFRSPPGVWVIFFGWEHSQISCIIHLDSTWSPDKLQMNQVESVESTCQIAVWIPPGLHLESIHQESRRSLFN